MHQIYCSLISVQECSSSDRGEVTGLPSALNSLLIQISNHGDCHTMVTVTEYGHGFADDPLHEDIVKVSGGLLWLRICRIFKFSYFNNPTHCTSCQ